MSSEIFGKIVDIRRQPNYKEKTILICFSSLRLFSQGTGDQAEEFARAAL